MQAAEQQPSIIIFPNGLFRIQQLFIRYLIIYRLALCTHNISMRLREPLNNCSLA